MCRFGCSASNHEDLKHTGIFWVKRMPPRAKKAKVLPPVESEPVPIPEPILATEPVVPPAKKTPVTRKKKVSVTAAIAPIDIPEVAVVEHVHCVDEICSHACECEGDSPIDAPHIILQLPIPADRIQDIVSKMEGANDGRGDPCPYVPNHYWTMSCSSFTSHEAAEVTNENQSLCHWCCHPITANKFGMPIDYDTVHNVFYVYGQFCSLSCAAAHNVATHMGSDRMWDVNGWLQMLAQFYQLPLPVRPAPSRYVLKMFGGPLSIDEFRAAHSTLARTVVLNVPPLVSVQPQVEWVNTSFLAGAGNGLNVQRLDGADDGDLARAKLIRRKAVVDSKRTLESKMNLTVITV